MRSHSFILRKSHLLTKLSSLPLRHTRLAAGTRVFSSNSSTPVEPHEASSVVSPTQSSESVFDEDQDKTNIKLRRTRISSSPSNEKDPERLELPDGLDILWLPTDSTVSSSISPNPTLPPEILEEALDNLLITLHPQNQHRAVHPSGFSSRLVEPTLGLYCPIEGGDYVVDATVRELASRTGSEVLVLDAVQLAAGEWGEFGKAANALNLPNNPLHFSSPPPNSMESSRQASSVEQVEEEGEGPSFFFSAPPRVSIAAIKAIPSIQGRTLIASPSRRTAPPPSKLETFLETLVNLPSVSEGLDNPPKNRPRLIYIRDFPTLAPSSSVWYPPLLAAVRNRRKGPISRPSSVVASPMTIIFGMTPPITPPNSSPGSTSSLISLLMNRNTSSSEVAQGGKSEGVHDWSESEAAELAREKRLRMRLKKWEKDATALYDEFPKLSTKHESPGSTLNPEIVVIGGPNGPSSSPSMLGMPIGFGILDHDGDTNSQFFRSSVLVPSPRSLSQERDTRVNRRREINELIVRMGVGAVGGVLESTPADLAFTNVKSATETSNNPPSSPLSMMWEKWGNKIEAWSNVRKIADRAMGSVMTSHHLSGKKATLDSTVVPWTAVQTAWATYNTLQETRKRWLKDASSYKFADDISADEQDPLNAELGNDKVVESVKNDPDLDPHEHRLISCIVDPNSMTTSFKQVHLPLHTIDSVRTIVSLPLLHPHAFQQGILKDYSMTGCLLFGPPGTGKTLVVRALAKEAGCRMLAISPSDVMDMYVGEGEKLVKAVFSLARRLSPCVVFLDEIDALFGARMSTRESGGAFAHRGVITEFMQEMDGLKSSKDDNVIVIGATNRPFDLDDAVLRRLPRRLLVDLPGEQERQEILKILLRDESLATDVTIEALAVKTDSFSGSDLKHLCVSAALDSVKEHVELPWKSEHPIASRSSESPNTPAVDIDGDSTSSESETPTAPTTVISGSSPSITISSPQQQLDENVTMAMAEFLPSSLPEVIAPAATIDSETSPSIIISSPQQPLNGDLPKDESPQPSLPGRQETPGHPTRILHLRNFLQALREITPSSSESFGSLAELRKWNEEFGEGRKDRKKRQVWGKGQFGFVEDTLQKDRVAKR
ncbi:AAA-domain-containing protein [Phlegmacium glaucopus]|nr:AAA-domain-containing protein [Phlegmacium glaucopus]